MKEEKQKILLDFLWQQIKKALKKWELSSSLATSENDEKKIENFSNISSILCHFAYCVKHCSFSFFIICIASAILCFICFYFPINCCFTIPDSDSMLFSHSFLQQSNKWLCIDWNICNIKCCFEVNKNLFAYKRVSRINRISMQ